MAIATESRAIDHLHMTDFRYHTDESFGVQIFSHLWPNIWPSKARLTKKNTKDGFIQKLHPDYQALRFLEPGQPGMIEIPTTGRQGFQRSALWGEQGTPSTAAAAPRSHRCPAHLRSGLRMTGPALNC